MTNSGKPLNKHVAPAGQFSGDVVPVGQFSPGEHSSCTVASLQKKPLKQGFSFDEPSGQKFPSAHWELSPLTQKEPAGHSI
jgi:hypothetical protein